MSENTIEINRNRYARLVVDKIQNSDHYREILNDFDELFNLIENGAEIRYLENPETNDVHYEAKLITDQLDNIASEQKLTG